MRRCTKYLEVVLLKAERLQQAATRLSVHPGIPANKNLQQCTGAGGGGGGGQTVQINDPHNSDPQTDDVILSIKPYLDLGEIFE